MLHKSMSIVDLAVHAHVKRGSIAARAEAIAVICHEMRNSLAIIRGTARLLRSSAEDDGVKTARSLIERQSDQMGRLIAELLPTQRHGKQAGGLRLSEIDLRAIAREAVDALTPEMARRGHRVGLTLPDEPIKVNADSGRLGQAFSNLLINAAKYTPHGGDITLTMERDHDQACVRIRDTGVGIEPAMLTRIFGMRFQAGGALPWAERGSGIGLAVVASVVELHGGTVKAASAGLGLGSEFTIVLPALRA